MTLVIRLNCSALVLQVQKLKDNDLFKKAIKSYDM